jgi:hypothetical protein
VSYSLIAFYKYTGEIAYNPLKNKSSGQIEAHDHEICNAEGCDARAIKKIRIPAGRFGFITLFVCENCEEKFIDE